MRNAEFFRARVCAPHSRIARVFSGSRLLRARIALFFNPRSELVSASMIKMQW